MLRTAGLSVLKGEGLQKSIKDTLNVYTGYICTALIGEIIKLGYLFANLLPGFEI